MGFPRFIISLTTILLIIFSNFAYSQIVFKELPGYRINFSDSSFFNLGGTRNIIPLNGEWVVYSAEDEEPKKISVNIPSIFTGEAQLIFEKTFNLTGEQVREKKVKLYFLGLNYFADIIVNDIVVYKHRGGEYPFTIELPRNILHSEKNNLVLIKLSYNLDPENTIPLKQRFFFPKNFGGILRDTYIYLEPNISIADFNISFNRDSKTNRLQLMLSERIDNKDLRRIPDTIDVKNEFTISINIFNPDQTLAGKTIESKFQLNINESKQFLHSLEISNPFYWSPEFPQLYTAEVKLSLDGEPIDSIKKDFPVYTFSSSFDELQLNGMPFSLNGVTYIPSFAESGSLASYNRMEEDIRLIKETGFNSVRFAKSIPHPYYLKLCEQYGLLAFLEIPLNYIPASFSADPNFITRSKNYLAEFVKGYTEFGSFAALGLGSSYLGKAPEHLNFVEELAASLPLVRKYMTYASFTGGGVEKINDLDLYGIEITGNSFINDTSGISSVISELGEGNIFFSSVTYIVNAGSMSGYANENTYEAQAKYFEDFLTAFSGEKTSGYFINTMFNYRGDYSSVISGYNENNIYNFGLISEDRSTAYLSQKVIQSKLHNADRVTIPIGSKSDSSPMVFIVVGLVLALIVGILVNSGRKFREDASRALLRPYNFFADVRDQRIMSSYHSTVLAVVLAVVMALILSSLFYYLRDNIVFEKILLSTGSAHLIDIIGYLAWNPFKSIVWLSVFFIAIIILMVIIIKFSSLFVRNRVYLSSIYFSVVWALIPLVLLIPVGIILYRALDAEVVNIYVYLGLILFTVWIFYRLMKGIYVIFDINPGPVYFYSIVIVLVLICSFVLYYEIKNSFIDYLMLTFKQYNISDLL
jgi:hypothetical protein